MRYTINHLPKSLVDVLALLYIYPDGALVQDIMVPLGISNRMAQARLIALLRSNLATYELEEEGKIWYPSYTREELMAMIEAADAL